MNNKLVVFILTHGRPQKVVTIEALKKAGFTGQIYFIIDNEDKTADKYIEVFGKDRVIVFNKKEQADQIDEGNNFDDRRATVHARNASFSIAEKLNLKYFILLEDDYTAFDYRLYINNKAIVSQIKDLDKVFDRLLEFYKSSNFTSIAIAQGGDFIGGLFNGKEAYRFSKRKCMNSFICSTDRPFRFVGQFNDDVNTYITLGSRGKVFLTIPFLSLSQIATQKQKSGMTEAYLRYGTYCKSFTTVMMHPSGVRVSMMNTTNPRIHHSIKWINTVPVILDEKWKKDFDLNSFSFRWKPPQNMPIGEEGRTIWDRSKQTEAELRECLKRGAGNDEQLKDDACLNKSTT